MQDVMVPCKKCGNKVPASSLKLDIDERMVICPDCIKNKSIHKEIKEEVFHMSEKRSFSEHTQKSKIFDEKVGNKIVDEEKSAKIAHKCTSCGYKFKIDPETRKPKNCPYCNARVISI